MTGLKRQRSGFWRPLDDRGATLVEFALLFPLYAALFLGIVEIGLALLFSMILSFGVDDGANYLMSRRQTYQTIDEGGLRQAVCAGIGMSLLSCDPGKLAVALVNADNPGRGAAQIAGSIHNQMEATDGGQYLLALGYNWGFMFPTTGFALPFSGPNAQLQSINLVIMAERVTE